MDKFMGLGLTKLVGISLFTVLVIVGLKMLYAKNPGLLGADTIASV